MTDKQWREKVKNLLKAELRRKGITYEELSERLAKIGVKNKAENINLKIHRGGFSAVFLIQCLEAIECNNLRLGD